MSRVEEAIFELQAALAEEYAHWGMSIHLEPNAFQRFGLELKGKCIYSDIPEVDYNIKSIKLATSCGYINIIEDPTLGESSYYLKSIEIK